MPEKDLTLGHTNRIIEWVFSDKNPDGRGVVGLGDDSGIGDSAVYTIGGEPINIFSRTQFPRLFKGDTPRWVSHKLFCSDNHQRKLEEAGLWNFS